MHHKKTTRNKPSRLLKDRKGNSGYTRVPGIPGSRLYASDGYTRVPGKPGSQDPNIPGNRAYPVPGRTRVPEKAGTGDPLSAYSLVSGSPESRAYPDRVYPSLACTRDPVTDVAQPRTDWIV